MKQAPEVPRNNFFHEICMKIAGYTFAALFSYDLWFK